MELGLSRYALARSFPHAWNVDILVAIIVEVGPAATHPSTYAFDPRFLETS